MALEAALVEKGIVATDAVDEFVDYMEHRVGPHHGTRVVAKAWTDPAFKARLLADGTAALAELDIAGPEGNVRVIENTPRVHNLVVCTLCSCYPWPLLGLPPIWYKSFAYRGGPSPNHAPCSASSGSSSGLMSRCGCGTRAPKCATSSYPNDQRASRASARRSWRHW